MEHQQQTFACEIINYCNMKDTIYKPCIKIFFLFEEHDNFYFKLFIQIFNSENVICVNDDTEIQDELAKSGKIIDKVDYFVTLVSQNLLQSYDLLKILITNYEMSKRFIMLIIDKFLYTSKNRKQVYDNWDDEIEKLNSQKADNDDTYNTLKSIKRAKALLPDVLSPLCSAMNTVTNKLEFLVKKLSNAFKSNFKTDDFLNYKGDDLKKFLNKQNQKLKGGTKNMKKRNQTPSQQQNAEKIYNINISGDNANAPIGDNNIANQYNNNLKDIQPLIESIKKEASKLNENDSTRIIYLLEDIQRSIHENNKPRLSNSLGVIDSLLSIASNSPVLFGLLQKLENSVKLLLG